MTTKQYILKQLTDRGLWPDEAEAILEQAKPDLEIGGYKITWDRPASEYPTQFYAAMMLPLSRNAVAWIDANKPMHFARMMFAPEQTN